MLLLLVLGCAHHGLVVHRDPDASVAFLSPAEGDNPHTLDIRVEGVNVDRVAIWAGGEPVGEVTPGETFRWRSDALGPLDLVAYGLRDGRAVTRAKRTVDVGAGLSAQVLEHLATYPADGSLGYYWPPDDGVWWGTARDLHYNGTLLSPADPQGRSHCVGLTWEIAMEVLEAQVPEGEPVNGLTLDDIAELRTDWFVRRLLDPGAAAAVERFGVGERVDAAHVRPGDFLQLWYPGHGGHSAIFLGWVKKGRKIVGVRYWSTHPATGGVGIREEAWGGHGISRSLFYAARLWPAVDWEPPRAR